MTKEEIAKALEGTKKPFNSNHYKYQVNNNKSKSTAVSEKELEAALRTVNSKFE